MIALASMDSESAFVVIDVVVFVQPLSAGAGSNMPVLKKPAAKAKQPTPEADKAKSGKTNWQTANQKRTADRAWKKNNLCVSIGCQTDLSGPVVAVSTSASPVAAGSAVSTSVLSVAAGSASSQVATTSFSPQRQHRKNSVATGSTCSTLADTPPSQHRKKQLPILPLPPSTWGGQEWNAQNLEVCCFYRLSSAAEMCDACCVRALRNKKTYIRLIMLSRLGE